jgi:hypothetical protein
VVRWLLILGAVLLLAVVGVLVAVPIAISRQLSPEGVARRASELAGQPVVVKGVELAFRPGLRIRAEGVTIGDHGAAEAVEVAIAIAPLLHRRIDPAELYLVGARIPLQRTPEGGFRIALFERRAGAGGGATTRLPALEARDGEIFVVEADGTRADAPVLRVERLELGPLAEGGRAPLRLDLAVEAAPGSRWSLGEARLEGALALREGRPAIESGRFEGRDARVRGLRIEDFQAEFAYAGGVVTIEALDFSAYGGTGSILGQLWLGGESRLDGEFHATGTELADAVADWRGRAPAHVDADRWSLGSARVQAAVTVGGGAARVESGRLEGRDARVRGLRIERFGGGFGYADGVVAIEALDFSAYGGVGSVSGDLRLAGPSRLAGEFRAASAEVARLVADWRGRAPAPVDADRWSLGPARVQASLTLDGGATRVESGRLEGRDARVRGLRIERFGGGFGYADGVVAIEALEFAAYGGEGSASGRVTPGPGRFEGKVALQGVALADLIADWRGKPFAGEPGRLGGEASLSLPFSDLAAGSGQGRVTLRDGRIPAASLFDTLLGSLGRLTGRLLSVGRMTAPAPSRVDALTAGFALRAGRLRSEDLELVTDDYRWRARGSLGLDASLDFTGLLQLTSRGLQRMLASGALPLPAATSVIPEIPLRVTGTLGKPSFSADAAGLPAASRGTLGGLVRGGGSVVKGAARGGESAVKSTARGLRKLTDKAIGRQPEKSGD